MRARAFAFWALVIFANNTFAGPEGGQIVGGAGSIAQVNAATTQVNQISQSMAINWSSFNVAAGETVQFVQPGTSAVVLNRILDQNPSTIFGTINANGHVFLVNTRGVLFAPGSQINVQGLIASGLDMDPAQFMEGNYQLAANGAAGYVVNHGVIAAATGGSVVLVGGQVLNTGTIRANYGRVTMAGADAGYVDFDGDGLMRFEVTGELKQKLEGEDAAVTNRGTIQANGGEVVMQAAAARGLFDTLVNNEGLISATGIDTSGGQVRLVADGGNVANSGTIDVSSVAGQAGTVTLSATDGKIVNSGVIDAQSQQARAGVVQLVATGGGIESNGDILATSVEGQGGFVLIESNADTLLSAGQVDVGSVEATGGTIHVLGERVAVMGPTRLGSSGGAGGG
ncbi:MAG TPA: filamentous hemagglutinin N-terminal domain-containing protein, partial [Verrucomicrobiae bacterium]|nr:filamentous hemagglutinin N-terminal domain-containing protein [Verrucomicrobiae bacterium]